jgi:catalase
MTTHDTTSNDNATTTDAGKLAPSDDYSLTAGTQGPILLQDAYLIEKMAHFNRERVPERVVHAKGSGAFGYFEATDDVSDFCKADFLRPGTRTPMLARFSTVAGEQGSPDTARDPRGFALKFYTQQGNYDLVGNNTPVFFIRDPSKFSDFIHSQKRLPDKGVRDNSMQWDFWTLTPASAHQVTILMSDRGTPKTYRNMHGYGSHTFLWENAGGEKFWIKYHLRTDQGVENFTDADAKAMAADEPDFHRLDLWDAIERGNAPSWTMSVQIMPYAEADGYRFNPFDLTKVWSQKEYPLHQVGRMVLDRNPDNFFAQIEQASFEPSNFVPGIGPSPDKMLLGRLFSYPDTHRHRIGANYLQLPVNQPIVPVRSYSVDGPMAYRHAGNQPVYAPNSFGGPHADPVGGADVTWFVEAGEMVRDAYVAHRDDDDFVQPGTLYREVMSDTDREHLITNVVGHLSKGVIPRIADKAIEYWRSVDGDLGAEVAKQLGS